MNNYNITLGQTYYNKGTFNPKAEASMLIGNHGEQIKIILKDQGEITTSINRTANKNGSVRLNPGNVWLEFLHKNYVLGDILTFKVVSPDEIQIL